MFYFVLKRIALLVPIFFGVTLMAFGFIRMLPGDPVAALAGERDMTPERHAEIMVKLGLDKPVWQQYLDYIWNLLHGDFGTSVLTNRPILDEFLELFPATIELGLTAMILAVVIGVPIGIFAAVKRGTFYDQGIMGISLVGYSMPIFWWGLLLIILFGGIWGLTPISGRISFLFDVETVTGFLLIDSLLSDEEGAFASAMHHMILPTIVLGTIPLAIIARQTRSAMLEVLSEDYVRTARAKGLSPLRVYGLHALRNAMITVITVIGLQVGTLMAGAILTETIFSCPASVNGSYFQCSAGIIMPCREAWY